jgi:tetratricopeptide (TPR) repeat protein
MDELRKLYEARQFAEAWALYSIDRECTDPEWHLYGALASWHLRKLFDSRMAAEAGLLCSPAGETEAKLHFIHGTGLREAGELCASIVAFDVCLSLLDRLDELRPLLRGACLHNRALALQATARLREALLGYQEASEEFERESMTNHLCQTLHHLAWVAIDLEDATTAGQAIERTSTLATSGIAQYRQRLVVARYDMIAGWQQDALNACENLSADESCPGDVKSLAFATGAELGLRQGAYEEAEQLARMAVKLAADYLSTGADGRCLTVASDVLRRVREKRMEAGV